MARTPCTVAVCIATYGRPAMLTRLLRSLADLRFTQPDPPRLHLIVVDNDVAGQAAELVRLSGLEPSWTVACETEPLRNISLARNRAVRNALERGAHYLAFIDDDEVAAPDWLEQLLHARDRFDADAVFGPVIPSYGPGTPEWVIEGAFFQPRRHQTGTRLDHGFTNNALVKADLFGGGTFLFDPAFGISGGGDTLFFMSALQRGATLVWTDEAVVTEEIPASRARAAFILRRAFRVGHAYVRCNRVVLPISRWLLPTIGSAVARIVAGLVLVLPRALRGRAGVVAGIRPLMHGLGTLSALAGFRYEEYTTVHGN